MANVNANVTGDIKAKQSTAKHGKAPYVQLHILPKPWKFYTIPDGVDGDIFQVW